MNSFLKIYATNCIVSKLRFDLTWSLRQTFRNYSCNKRQRCLAASFLTKYFICRLFSQTSYTVEALPDSVTAVGEGPHWDIATQSLYFVDINVGKLLRYDYAANKVYHCKLVGEDLASFIVPIEGQPNKFAVGCGRRVSIVCWDGKAAECKVERDLFSVQMDDEKYNSNRFNDAKCDPRGRLFAGTMHFGTGEFEHRLGELYMYDRGKLCVVKSDVSISNGLAWNEKAKKFYFIDTADYDVKEYDYDVATGLVCNPKVVYDLRRNNVKDHLWPDGMTIDTEGNIYVATFNGYTVFKVNPSTGKVLLEIKLPCMRITSAAFGGPKLDILYVTTSSRFGEKPPAGTTYKVTGLCAKGTPMTNMCL